MDTLLCSWLLQTRQAAYWSICSTLQGCPWLKSEGLSQNPGFDSLDKWRQVRKKPIFID